MNSLESVLLRQKKRIQFVTDVCRNLPQDATKTRDTNKELVPSDFQEFFVDDTRRILYCQIPKVACTSWKRILLVLSGGLSNISNPEDIDHKLVHGAYREKYLRTLDRYSPMEIQYRLDKYYKFMFVRDPMERILSAYRDKFDYNRSTYFTSRMGKQIVRRYRVNASNDSLEKGHDVTFQEFVIYLLDPFTTKLRPLNHHWGPYHKLCHPCLVQYDLIGKYETLSEDAGLALKQMGVEHLIKFPRHELGPSETKKRLSDAYANISAAHIYQLWKLYSTDFLIFNYDYPRL